MRSAGLRRHIFASDAYVWIGSKSLTSADKVWIDFLKSSGCAATQILRSARNAITDHSDCRQHCRKRRRVHTRLDADPNLANLDLDTATALTAGRCHLRGICMRRRRQTRWIDPYPHEPWHRRTNRPRHLHRQRPAYHSVSPRDLGYVRAFFETLGDNPRLLLGRPPAPPTLPCDQFDPTIFLPGIKHGICHRLTSNDQLMPGRTAGDSREG
jgi:hypothetical protein